MNDVEEYILQFTGAKREIMLFFHGLFIEDYKLKPKISFKIPMYYRNTWVVYLNSDNRKGVELAFTNGHEFDINSPLIESKGRKLVRSAEFESLNEIPYQNIKTLMKEAIRIDDLH